MLFTFLPYHPSYILYPLLHSPLPHTNFTILNILDFTHFIIQFPDANYYVIFNDFNLQQNDLSFKMNTTDFEENGSPYIGLNLSCDYYNNKN